jgi:hypothetical protein
MANESIHPMTTDLPSTLTEWRAYCTFPLLAVWEFLRDWFASEGLYLFSQKMEDRSAYVLLPVNELRAHDGTYSTHYAPPDIEHANVVCEQCIFALPIC